MSCWHPKKWQFQSLLLLFVDSWQILAFWRLAKVSRCVLLICFIIFGGSVTTMKNTGAGRNKKKKTIKERMLYYFDIWLSKGTLPTIILLFVIMFIVFTSRAVTSNVLF